MRNLDDLGFAILDSVFSDEELNAIINEIDVANSDKTNFRGSDDLYAIRQFFKEVPGAVDLIFTAKFVQLLRTNLGNDFFVVKSIYFDKPAQSNWYVPYHQDLTISVENKKEVDGFQNWTQKQNQFSVQPPVHILKNITTIRIHLDETKKENGALHVITRSHLKGIVRPEIYKREEFDETICPVNRGGVMLMKPLLMHRSGRTTNQLRRRVIHIEFSNLELPDGLTWSERI